MRRYNYLGLHLLWLGAVAGCSGGAGNDGGVPGAAGNAVLPPGVPNAAGGAGPGGPGLFPPNLNCNGVPDVSSGPLRRLTKLEYNNLVADLLGDTRDLGARFGEDEKLGRFSVNVDAPASEQQVEQYLEAAESVAKLAVEALPKVLPCDPAALGEDACAQQFINQFGERAFRRPLTPEEAANITSVYQAAKTGADFKRGIHVAIERVLTSPHFLYHVELGAGETAPGVVPVSSYEQAARLSFFLWRSAPDATLLAAAAAGELATAAGIETQALRMLKDDRAARTLRNFHTEWLGLGELAETENAPPPASMREESLRTLDEVVWQGSGKLDEFFSTTVAYLDGPLREFYGVQDAAADPATFTRYELDPATRAGVLTRAGFLAGNDNPSRRGKFIREEVLCGLIPPPPPAGVPKLGETMANETPRDAWERHVSDPACGGCHILMDPLGFGFEHYDEEGHYRTMFNDLPIDNSGEVTGTKDVDGPYVGAQELQQKLATSKDVRECMTQQWFRFALSRDPHEEQDGCSVVQANTTFATSGYKIQDLMLAVTKSDSFRHRRIEGAAQ